MISMMGAMLRVVDMDVSRGSVSLRNPKSEGPPREFTFDSVYDWKYVCDTL